VNYLQRIILQVFFLAEKVRMSYKCTFLYLSVFLVHFIFTWGLQLKLLHLFNT